MHTTTMTRADRAALENLWGDAGAWAADTWTRLGHFDGQAPLSRHRVRAHSTRHTSNPDGRITLHPAPTPPIVFWPWRC
jgi:hypothetical protein